MKKKAEKLRVALVHDYLNQSGGAEVALRYLHQLFPTAPVYTLIYDPPFVPADFRSWDIRPVGWSKHLPFIRKLYKHYLPLYPSMVEQINVRDYDLVISSSYLWAKGVISHSDTLHVSYCYTPMRQAWELYFEYKESYSRFVSRFVYPFAFNYLRLWDTVSAERVDNFIAISETVRKRIAKFYRRPSVVVNPPVELDGYSVSNDIGDYYLCLSRLVPYKKVDVAVEAFNRLGKKLIIAGSGQQMKHLRRIAKDNVTFEGFVSQHRKRELLSHCTALIFPGEEDFGIVPVEAQAAGRPVIAYGRGGATETILDGETGLLYYEPTVDALCDSVERFEKMRFEPEKGVANARNYGVDKFLLRMNTALDEYVRQFFGDEYGTIFANTVQCKLPLSEK